MISRFAFLAALAPLALSPPHASAQVNEKFADMTPEINLVRSMAQVERKNFVALDMELTDEQSAAFWPVYEDYRAAVVKVQDGLVKVVTDYVAQRDTLTDEQARNLLNEYLAVEQNLLKTRKAYVARFAKVLPMAKVMRFYQIENKLDTVARLELAREIPLAK